MDRPNVVAWNGSERRVAEYAMWRVVKEYVEAHSKNAAVNIWHLPMDMEKARGEAVRALKESEAKVG